LINASGEVLKDPKSRHVAEADLALNNIKGFPHLSSMAREGINNQKSVAVPSFAWVNVSNL
jgi:hypothetical protein